MLWRKKTCSAAYVVFSARLTLDQWKHAQSRKFKPLLVPSGDNQSGDERWTKVATNMIKINVYGSILEVDNAYGAGLLARNHNGQVIEAFAICNLGCVKSEIAEIISIKEALSWIKEKRWQNFIIETDCLVAVQALQCSIQMPSVFGFLVSDCKHILSSLINIQINFLKRSANEAAHCLARGSHLWSGCKLSAGSIPVALQDIVAAELVD